MSVVFCHWLQLEKAAAAGVVLVVCLVGLLATEAVNQRFPAIQAGELPLWSLKVDGHLPEAFAVVGYAFYMQVCCATCRHDACDNRYDRWCYLSLAHHRHGQQGGIAQSMIALSSSISCRGPHEWHQASPPTVVQCVCMCAAADDDAFASGDA